MSKTTCGETKRTHHQNGCTNEATPPHSCPFDADVYDDPDTKCRCCEECQQECSDAI